MNRLKHRFIAAAVALSAVLGASSAMAGTTTSNLAASVALTSDCTLTTTPIAFGTVDTLNYTSVKPTGVMSLTCTGGTSAKVSINAGLGVGATTGVRYMTDSTGDTLRYALYQSTAGTFGWDSTVTVTFASTGTQTLNAVGVLVTGQAIIPGTYADTVTVSVAY